MYDNFEANLRHHMKFIDGKIAKITNLDRELNIHEMADLERYATSFNKLSDALYKLKLLNLGS